MLNYGPSLDPESTEKHMSSSFFSSKVLISLDNTFSWLFLLVCFDTKPLFLKVKKVKKRCSAGHRNLLLHTSSFKKPKQFGFYISKDIWGLFYFTRLPFIPLRLTSKSKYFANQCKIKLTSEEICILSAWIFTKRHFFLDKDKKRKTSSNFTSFIVFYNCFMISIMTRPTLLGLIISR